MDREQSVSPEVATARDNSLHRPLGESVPWYDISDPSSPALDELAARFGFHELQVEDCRHRPQRAKTEEHDGYVFSVLKHLHTDQRLSFDDLDVFLGADFLVTVRSHDCAVIHKVCERAQQEHIQRVDKICYFILDYVVDEYQPELDALADDINEIEGEVLKCPGPEILSQILDLKRGLIEFRRIAAMMREVVNALIRREGGLMADELDPYLRDVYDHLVRTVDMIETYRDLLTGSLDIYLTAVANRTNEVMKVLTVWGTVSVPLVIITGFFGMNLHLPWMNDPHGVWYASALMLGCVVAVLAYFRGKHWI